MNTFVKAEVWTVARTEQGNAVLVRPVGADVAVPIFIGQMETQSILIGLGKVDMPRPLTHDLMVEFLGVFDTSLARIEINDLRDGTFYARLVLDKSGAETFLDSRPSDAIALAVRTHCPVYISESVVDAAGIAVNLVVEAAVDASEGDENEEDPASDDASPRLQLERQLAEAVEREDYESAAKIRDMLKGM